MDMPKRMYTGTGGNTMISFIRSHTEMLAEYPKLMNPLNRPTLSGFVIPEWQRPIVWTEAQSVRFIESAWFGLHLGTFVYNDCLSDVPELTNVLIDGQQRIHALVEYMDDAFPVFGAKWSGVGLVDRRRFLNATHFASSMCKIRDDAEIRDLYNRMNFGGTAHTEDQRA